MMSSPVRTSGGSSAFGIFGSPFSACGSQRRKSSVKVRLLRTMCSPSGPGPHDAPPRPRTAAKIPSSVFVTAGSSCECIASVSSVGEYGIAEKANGAPSVTAPKTVSVPSSALSPTPYVSSRLPMSCGFAYPSTISAMSRVQRDVKAPLLRSG